MIEQPNPYEASTAEQASSDRSLPRGSIFWPHTPVRCILIALFAWPLVMFATDIVGIYVERWADFEDFGKAASNFTMAPVCLYAAVLWFRAFMSRDRLVGGFFLALLTFPGWFIFTAIITVMNFPFGRTNPYF